MRQFSYSTLKARKVETANLMFIGPCIIAIVDEWKTNLMSLATLFHLLCAHHVSDINISIFRSLRLCWWITTSVVLFSVRCVLELLLRLVFGGVRFAGFLILSLYLRQAVSGDLITSFFPNQKPTSSFLSKSVQHPQPITRFLIWLTS